MREPESPEQKSHIIIHDVGIGVPTPDLVIQRAREIALIAGRAASDYTEEDFRAAKRELMDQMDNGARGDQELPFEPGSGDVLGGRGHHAANFGADDETTLGERLIHEGLDEALHDEMLEASKKNIHDAS